MDKDLVRRMVVTASAVFCLIGTLYGVGVLGTRVEESSGGALAADATLIAPAGPAFSIWSVIYLGLGAYVVWQWMPSNRDVPRARETGWLAALSMILNGGWLLVTQQGWLWLSVAVIVALAGVLKRLVWVLGQNPPEGGGDRVVLDVTFGLYLGWVAVATCANIAAALVESGFQPSGRAAEVITVLVLIAVLGVAVLYGRWFNQRWAVAGAMAWGVGWVAYGRLADQPESAVVGAVAALVAIGILASNLYLGRVLAKSAS